MTLTYKLCSKAIGAIKHTTNKFVIARIRECC